MLPVLILLTIALLCPLACLAQSREGICPSDGTIMGYSTIQDLNLDMAEIFINETAMGPYEFSLCPNTIYDVGEVPLTPILSDTLIVCGDGSEMQGCVFDGGERQVVLRGDIFNVTILGIEFRNFANASIIGNASVNSTVLLDRCTWRQFMSPFVVEIFPDSPDNDAMIMLIQDSFVAEGVGGSLISNDGGLLQIENMTAGDLTAVGLIVSGNFAETNVNILRVIMSELTYVAFATSSSIVTIQEALISENMELSEVFFATDNSELFVETSSVVFNEIVRTEEEGGWSIGSVRGTNSTVGMNNMRIEGNANVQFCLSSDTESEAFLSDSLLRNNSGIGTSALVFAVNDASFTVERVLMEANVDFTFNFFAFNGSFVTFNENCMIGGSAQSAAFMGEATQYIALGNFIDQLETIGCNAPGPRLFKEDPGANCFNGGVNCSGICEVMADATTCIINDATLTPTTVTSPAPSVEPGTPVPSIAPAESPGPTVLPTEPPVGTPSPSIGTQVPTLTPTIPPTSPPVDDPTSAPVLEPTLSPVVDPTSAPILEPTTPTTQPVEAPVVPTVPTKRPTPQRKPLPPKPKPRYPYWYKVFDRNAKKSKSRKSKSSKSNGHYYHSKTSKSHFYTYYKDQKGTKSSKGYKPSYHRPKPPPPRPKYPHGGGINSNPHPWRPPKPQHQNQNMSNHFHNQGKQTHKRQWVGSTKDYNTRVHTRQHWNGAEDALKFRSTGNYGKKPGLRPH